MWRTVLGISVVIIAVFSLSVASLLAGKPLFEAARPYAAGALVAAGVAAWFTGRVLAKQRKQAAESTEDSEFSIFDLRYWGPMFVLLGVITLFVWPLGQPIENASVVAAPSPKKKPIVPVVLPPPLKPALVATNTVPPFPPMKLQGVMIRDGSSFAILNGEAYTVGDRIGAVLVKRIDRDAALVEMNGKSKLLKLE
jgi:membrane protease YdiL (CAAX protease family)